MEEAFILHLDFLLYILLLLKENNLLMAGIHFFNLKVKQNTYHFKVLTLKRLFERNNDILYNYV